MLPEWLRKLRELNRRPTRPLRGNDDMVNDTGSAKDYPYRYRIRLSEKRQHMNDLFSEIPRLDDIVTGNVIKNPKGHFLLAEKDIGDFISDPDNVHRVYASAMEKIKMGLKCGKEDFSEGVADLLRMYPERVLYLDIETTGLFDTPLFLIGIMFYKDMKFRIHQLLAREYSEEAPLLEYLSGFVSNYDCLVTYNGKSFDIPFIKNRAFANNVKFNISMNHLDLLHECRKRYKGMFDNCKLKTMESMICFRERVDDIPGHEIPVAYHHFVRTGNAWRMGDILYHNGLDLITMAELVVSIIEGYE